MANQIYVGHKEMPPGSIDEHKGDADCSSAFALGSALAADSVSLQKAWVFHEKQIKETLRQHQQDVLAAVDLAVKKAFKEREASFRQQGVEQDPPCRECAHPLNAADEQTDVKEQVHGASTNQIEEHEEKTARLGDSKEEKCISASTNSKKEKGNLAGTQNNSAPITVTQSLDSKSQTLENVSASTNSNGKKEKGNLALSQTQNKSALTTASQSLEVPQAASASTNLAVSLPVTQKKSALDAVTRSISVFKNFMADVAAVRDQRSKEEISESPNGWGLTLSERLNSVVSSDRFDYAVGMLIILNVIFMAYQTDWVAQNPNVDQPEVMRAIDLSFTLLFTAELVMRMVSQRKQFFMDEKNRAWNGFDFIVVVSSLAEEFLALQSNIMVLRVLRILRLIRIIKFIRVMPFFSDLRIMMVGIATCWSSLIWAMVLLGLIMFIFAVCIVQLLSFKLAEELDDVSAKLSEEEIQFLRERFSAISYTMWCLFQAISGGSDWNVFGDPLGTVSPILGAAFCFYVLLTVFAVLNIITGVFVDNAHQAKQNDTDIQFMEQSNARNKIIDDAKVCFESLKNPQGMLTWTEFEQHLGDDDIQRIFHNMEIDVEEPRVFRDLFTMLDFSGTGSIDIDEFIYGCTHLKGQARSLDLARVIHLQREHGNSINAIRSDLWELISRSNTTGSMQVKRPTCVTNPNGKDSVPGRKKGFLGTQHHSKDNVQPGPPPESTHPPEPPHPGSVDDECSPLKLDLEV